MITPWGGSGANHAIVIEFMSAFGECNSEGDGGTAMVIGNNRKKWKIIINL